MVESCYIKPTKGLRVYNPEEFNYLFPDQWTRVKFGSYWRRRWKSNEILCQEDKKTSIDTGLIGSETEQKEFKKALKREGLDGDLV